MVAKSLAWLVPVFTSLSERCCTAAVRALDCCQLGSAPSPLCCNAQPSGSEDTQAALHPLPQLLLLVSTQQVPAPKN